MASKYLKRNLLRGAWDFDPESFKTLMANLELEPKDSENLLELMQYLFPASSGANKDRKSIRNPENFKIYFDNNLTSKGLLFREVTPILDLSWPEIKQRLQAWNKEGRLNYLIDVLKSTDAIASRERFEKISKIWVTLINWNYRPDDNFNEWVRVIRENKSQIDRMYGSDLSFFDQVFIENNECFFFSTYVIRILLRLYIDKGQTFEFPVSKTRLQEISLQRLTRYEESRNEFDIRVFNLFYYNCWKEKGSHDNVIILDEANNIVRKHIEKFPEAYLRFTVRPKYTPHIDGEYVFEPFLKQYFGEWKVFEDFLRGHASKNSEFDVLIGYYEQFKKNEFKSFHSEENMPWIDDTTDGTETSLKIFKHQTYQQFVDEFESKLNQ
jgi:hypothetical protein